MAANPIPANSETTQGGIVLMMIGKEHPIKEIRQVDSEQTLNRRKNRINPKRNFLQEIKRIEK